MIDFCILGSGISGSTIANLISKKYTVQVFEKARGAGGRASTRKYKDNLSFDHGAQYISTKNKSFKKFLNLYRKKKYIKLWNKNHLDFNFKKCSSEKFIGKKGNNDISKHLLKGIKVQFSSEIKNINFTKNYWVITFKNNKRDKFKYLVLTCPFPQLKKLASKYLNKKILKLNVKMKPNITVMAAYQGYKGISISSLKFNDDIISWAANENSKKRFKSNEMLWTIQSNEKWANKNINIYKKKKKLTIKLILDRFEALTGFEKKKLVFSKIHGWKYSYNNNSTKIKSFWSKKYNLGVCGDWFIGPKIENAWESAQDLYKKIN